MTRAEAIRAIEASYPADATAPAARNTGQRLLARARAECVDWRDEPDAVLVCYAQLCAQETRYRESCAERGLNGVSRETGGRNGHMG